MNSAPAFSEYEPVGLSEPLRQGDVLERVEPEATPWNRLLLVITADCDFAHGKHQGRVTCVPLMTKDEYLLELQLPKLRELATTKLVAALSKVLTTIGAPDISAARLRNWPLEQTTTSITDALRVPEATAAMVGPLLDGIREVSQRHGSVSAAVAALVQAQLQLPNAQSEKNMRSQIADRLQNAFKQPPGDALFLSAIGAGYDYGYFAYLRHLEQIWEPDVAVGPGRSVAAYRRVSRLQDTYTHAIAQRFALVFMSIGLPDSYEEMRDLHAELLGGDLT